MGVAYRALILRALRTRRGQVQNVGEKAQPGTVWHTVCDAVRWHMGDKASGFSQLSCAAATEPACPRDWYVCC